MLVNISTIVISSILFLAATLLLHLRRGEHMLTMLQLDKLPKSPRYMTVNDAASKPPIYSRQFTDIKGRPLNADQLRRKVILLVNTASECRYTPQMHGLQELHDRYKHIDFTVLGVPCNDFGEQEPGDERHVLSFYESKYKTTFPLTNKQDVKKPSEVFQWIIDAGGKDFLPIWNFHKYLIDRKGHLIAAWNSEVNPVNEEIVDAIESVL